MKQCDFVRVLFVAVGLLVGLSCGAANNLKPYGDPVTAPSLVRRPPFPRLALVYLLIRRGGFPCRRAVYNPDSDSSFLHAPDCLLMRKMSKMLELSLTKLAPICGVDVVAEEMRQLIKDALSGMKLSSLNVHACLDAFKQNFYRLPELDEASPTFNGEVLFRLMALELVERVVRCCLGHILVCGGHSSDDDMRDITLFKQQYLSSLKMRYNHIVLEVERLQLLAATRVELSCAV